jgi:hypothetical protein
MNETQQGKKQYPYVVRRIMAAVYQQLEVVFTTDPSDPPPRKAIHILIDQPARNAEGDLVEKARMALIDVLKEVTRTSGFRMCAVFGEQDSVYVEPDGQVNWLNEAPSGGVNL